MQHSEIGCMRLASLDGSRRLHPPQVALTSDTRSDTGEDLCTEKTCATPPLMDPTSLFTA